MVRVFVGHETDSYVLKAGKTSDLIPEKPTGQNKIG